MDNNEIKNAEETVVQTVSTNKLDPKGCGVVAGVALAAVGIVLIVIKKVREHNSVKAENEEVDPKDLVPEAKA